MFVVKNLIDYYSFIILSILCMMKIVPGMPSPIGANRQNPSTRIPVGGYKT